MRLSRRFPKSGYAITLCVLVILVTSAPLWPSDLKITYLANEGVLIDCQGKKVLIDALFRDSLDDYMRHPPEVQEKLETGKPPFDGVGLALATHFHLDHWDAGAISRFLINNPSALFASTPEATAMLPHSLQGRVRALWPDKDHDVHLAIPGILVDAFALEHGNTQIPGTAFQSVVKWFFTWGMPGHLPRTLHPCCGPARPMSPWPHSGGCWTQRAPHSSRTNGNRSMLWRCTSARWTLVPPKKSTRTGQTSGYALSRARSADSDVPTQIRSIQNCRI